MKYGIFSLQEGLRNKNIKAFFCGKSVGFKNSTGLSFQRYNSLFNKRAKGTGVKILSPYSAYLLIQGFIFCLVCFTFVTFKRRMSYAILTILWSQ